MSDILQMALDKCKKEDSILSEEGQRKLAMRIDEICYDNEHGDGAWKLKKEREKRILILDTLDNEQIQL